MAARDGDAGPLLGAAPQGARKIPAQTIAPTFSPDTSRAPVTPRERAYAAKTVADEAAKLSAMQPGGRNQALNDAALRLGEMVGSGWIDCETVVPELWEAATINGYRAKDGDGAAWATLRSGLTAGMKNPRSPLRTFDQTFAIPQV